MVVNYVNYENTEYYLYLPSYPLLGLVSLMSSDLKGMLTRCPGVGRKGRVARVALGLFQA